MKEDRKYLAIYSELIAGTRVESEDINYIGPGLTYSYEDIENYADSLIRDKIIRTRKRDLLIAELMKAINNYYLGLRYYNHEDTSNPAGQKLFSDIAIKNGLMEAFKVIKLPKNRRPHYYDHGLVRASADLWVEMLPKEKITVKEGTKFDRFVDDLASFINPGRIPISRDIKRAALANWELYQRQHHVEKYRPSAHKKRKRRTKVIPVIPQSMLDEQQIIKMINENERQPKRKDLEAKGASKVALDNLLATGKVGLNLWDRLYIVK